MCFALLRICAKPDSLLLTFHTEEGINLDDYHGEGKETVDNDDEDEDDDNNDND